MNAILLAALALQASPLEEFFKFKPETTWTYKRVENGEERKIVGKVTGEESGKVKLDWKDYEKSGAVKESSVVTWSVVDRVLTAEAKGAEGDQTVLSFAVLKEGAKKDDRWTSPAGEVTHMGAVEVTVPAGTYKNAIRTQLKLGEDGGDGKIDFYLVPKVGLVKVEVLVAGSGDNRFELSKFEEPKK